MLPSKMIPTNSFSLFTTELPLLMAMMSGSDAKLKCVHRCYCVDSEPLKIATLVGKKVFMNGFELVEVQLLIVHPSNYRLVFKRVEITFDR